jgi:RNA polymerase sigma-70 factor (ECF subfamily)
MKNDVMTDEAPRAAEAFEPVRGRLFGLAYRMLGSRAEAEDVVQDAYIRWHQADRAAVDNAEAWLVTTATRLAIDRLRAAAREREAYRGQWLPEPIFGGEAPDPHRHLDMASDLSMAFLVLLERLAPDERAAFLLHDVFDCGYGVVARALGKSEAACRQTVHRARTRIRSERRRFEASEGAKRRLLDAFAAALQAQDEQTLRSLFAPDATWTADGGGRTPASPHPIVGADRIARLVLGLRRGVYSSPGLSFRPATINGETALTIFVGGRLVGTLSIATDGDRIIHVYAVVNPEKLGEGDEARH